MEIASSWFVVALYCTRSTPDKKREWSLACSFARPILICVASLAFAVHNIIIWAASLTFFARTIHNVFGFLVPDNIHMRKHLKVIVWKASSTGLWCWSQTQDSTMIQRENKHMRYRVASFAWSWRQGYKSFEFWILSRAFFLLTIKTVSISTANYPKRGGATLHYRIRVK